MVLISERTAYSQYFCIGIFSVLKKSFLFTHYSPLKNVSHINAALTWNLEDGETDVVLVDDSRMVKFEENIGDGNSRWLCHQKFTKCNFMPSSMLGFTTECYVAPQRPPLGWRWKRKADNFRCNRNWQKPTDIGLEKLIYGSLFCCHCPPF